MKITCLRFLLATLLAIVVSTGSIMGQNFAQIETEGTPGPLPCNGIEYYVSIKVANLGLLLNSNASILPLPASYPDMYCNYTIGTSAGVLVALPQFELLSIINGIHYYEARIPLGDLKDYETECLTNGEDGLLTVPYTIEILTNQNGQYVSYPMCTYTAPGDIFDCNAFDETAGFCTVQTGGGQGLGTNCHSPTLATVTGDLIYSCRQCGNDSGFEGPGGRNALDNEEDFTEVQVQPNPFQNYIEVNWPDTEVEEVRLLDVSGKILSQHRPSSNAGNSLTLDTGKLPAGLYFLQLRNSKTSKVVKMIKH